LASCGSLILLYLLAFAVADRISQVPHEVDFSQCFARVNDSRAALFQPDIYLLQFNFTTWLFSNVTADEFLCGEGFEGNPDIYGLGIRVGIYLQWASCLIANHTLPETRIDLAKSYLIFLIAIVVTVFVMSFQTSCNFALEIVLLYYMYFGGNISVFTWPNLTTANSQTKWLGMTWHGAIISILNIFMYGHSTWFWVWGYNTVFARLPCGTHHFFFGKISDPGAFMVLRWLFAMNSITASIWYAFLAAVFAILFIGEIRRSILESDIYRGLFPRGQYRRVEAPQDRDTSLYSKIFAPISAYHSKIHTKYADFLARFLGVFVELKRVVGMQKRSAKGALTKLAPLIVYL
jgi:hypothetical protein